MDKNKQDEKIVVNLKTEEEDESVQNLSQEEKDKVGKIKEKLREELGIEIQKEIERLEKLELEKQAKEKASQNVPEPVVEKPVETKEKLVETEEQKKAEQIKKIVQKEQDLKVKQEADVERTSQQKYSSFLKQYSKKDDTVENLVTYGKYDSELDFRINRNIKKVRFPMPKHIKILLSCIVFLVVVLASVSLAIVLYDAPQEIILTKISLTQPTSSSYYLVNNVYVGDSVNYSNIYINCEYSDGSTKQVALASNMVDTSAATIISNGVFIESGEAVVTVNYSGKTLKLKYLVEDKSITGISLFTAQNITAIGTTLDISKKVIVNANYSNGETVKVELKDCLYKLAGMENPAQISNGILNVGELNNGQQYVVAIYYGEFSQTFTITAKISQE